MENLGEAELSKVKSYMNFDMIGSDNYIVGTLDSDGSDVPIPDGVNVPEGSAELEGIFTDFFADIDQPNVGTDVLQDVLTTRRSSTTAFPPADCSPWRRWHEDRTGAEWFGGTVGDKHDTNYHQPTDTIENVEQGVRRHLRSRHRLRSPHAGL